MNKILFLSVFGLLAFNVNAAETNNETKEVVKAEVKEATMEKNEDSIKKYKNKRGNVLITNQKLTEEQEKEYKLVKEIK